MNTPFLVVLHPFNEKHTLIEKHINKAYLCKECLSFANPHSRIENSENKFYCNICGGENKIDEEIEMVDPSVEYYGMEDKTEKEEIKEVCQGYFNRKIYNSALMIFGIEFTRNNSININEIIDKIEEIIKDPSFKENFSNYAIILFNTNCEILTIEKGEISIKKFIGENVLITPKYTIDVNTDNTLLFRFLRSLKPSEKDSHPDILFPISNGLCNFFVGGKTAIFMTHSRPLSFIDSVIEEFIESKNSLFIFDAGERTAEHPFSRIILQTNGALYSIDKISRLTDVCLIETIYGVIVELKTSDFIKKSNIYANTSLESTYQLYFSSMDKNTTISYEFLLDENMKDGQHLYIQPILRYFRRGEYKTMVLNQSFISSTKYSNVYNNLSLDVIFSFFCKFISTNISDMQKRKEESRKMIVDILRTYRIKCSPEAKPSQLVLPENIKSLPNLYQSLCKNILYGTKINYYNIKKISNSPLKNIIRYFYPRFFSFTEYFIEKNIKNIKALQLNYKSIDSEEIYILENGEKIYIYIGSAVDRELIDIMTSYRYSIDNYNKTEEEKVLDRMILELEEEYSYSLELSVVLQGISTQESEVLGYMIEERMSNLQGYAEFLCDIHYDIQQW
ncbi:MAG: Sec23/Sec24 zinc finger-containing protein [Cetobacterium sp.]